ncbi:ABC transporter substrate-binding protein [Chitinophaga sp. Cy-1792]|uniref:ABC transporter substrate-binding protein n=1 Tax=Chitinophaga sp. Cy-1792 TaxID=2608339 RepID=UPI0014206887|nr:ABC transporter substrate-binding protein [Chitinophaga sp. Cy-1792]NIG55801.1 ABC transporter substrate-binding protein [Chitinophaga sp. Cy-1792]
MQKYQNETAELEALYALAREEQQTTKKQFLIWAGGDAPNQQDQLYHQFKNRFPGIDIEIIVDLSKYHDLKVYEQLNDGYLEADVVMLQTMNDFENWKKMEVLEAFKPAGFQHIREGYSDPDGYFMGAFIFAFLPQYAKEGVGFVPKTYQDFLTPIFKDKLVLTPPHDDDAVLYVFDHIIQKYGVKFLQELKKQNPVFVRGTAAPAALVGQKGFLGNIVGYPTYPDQPSQSFIPEDDFFITWPQRAAMFKLTENKAAARLFLAYLASYEFQSGRGSWSTRTDVTELGGLQPIQHYKNTDPLDFIKWMRNRNHIHELRSLFTEIFGKVEGESPLKDPSLMRVYYNTL